MTTARIFLVLGSVISTGCGWGDFDHLEASGVRVSRLRLSVGSSSSFDFVAFDTEGHELPCDVALASRDSDVLLAEKTTSGATLVSGLSPGKTPVVVYCDGDAIGAIPGEVTASQM